MVAFTVSQMLPYAEDGDQVCDSPSILQDLAETVEDRLGSLEDDYDILALRPAGKMKTSQQATYVPFAIINWDQVEFDTTNIIDLDVDTEAIRPPAVATGTPNESWYHGAHIVITGSGVNTDMAGVALSNPSGAFQSDQRDDAAFNSGHSSYTFHLTNATAVPALYAYASPTTAGSTPATLNMLTAENFAFKVGDLS